MKSIRFTPLFVFLIVFSLSCAFVTQSISGGGNGPSSFTAEATPYGSVKLSWEAVEGAQGYLLETQLDELDFFITVAELSADQTSYEDYLAPEESTLTYRLQATTDGEAGGYSTTSVTTVAVQPNPLTVQATFAEDQVVTQSIGAEGGSLSLTDSNGVIYELQVPAGAVLEATDFTLTPVTDIQGWPLDGANLGSVRIGPESLDLYAYLTLTISLPQDLPQDETFPVGYGFDGSGDEFHLQPITIAAAETSALPNGGGIQAMPILFQPKEIVVVQLVRKPGAQGVAWGSKGRIIDVAQQHPPTDAGVNAGQKQVAQQAADDDLPPLPILSPAARKAQDRKNGLLIKRQMTDLLNRLNKAEKNKKTDCASATNAVDESIDIFNRTAEVTTLENRAIYLQPELELWEALDNAVKTAIKKGLSECEQSKPGKPPASYGCMQKLLNRMQAVSKAGRSSQGFRDREIHVPFNSDELIEFQKTLKYKCKPKFAYQAEGPGVSSKPVCDFTKPFTLTIKNEGTVIYSFDSGSWKNKLIFPGCTASGTGTYTLPIYDDAEELTMNIAGDVGGSCGLPFAGSGGFSIVWKKTADVCP